MVNTKRGEEPGNQQGKTPPLLPGSSKGRKSKKEGIYVYIWLIHFAVQQKLTQNCKATISQLKNKQTN